MKRVPPARRTASQLFAGGGFLRAITPAVLVLPQREHLIPASPAPCPNPYQKPDGRIQIGPLDI